jgi:hypothetical protein
MQVHIFRGPARVFGFTGDATGASLPAQYAPWNHFKTLEMSKGEAIPGVNAAECLDDIERFGYHLTDATSASPSAIMPEGPLSAPLGEKRLGKKHPADTIGLAVMIKPCTAK